MLVMCLLTSTSSWLKQKKFLVSSRDKNFFLGVLDRVTHFAVLSSKSLSIDYNRLKLKKPNFFNFFTPEMKKI